MAEYRHSPVVFNNRHGGQNYEPVERTERQQALQDTGHPYVVPELFIFFSAIRILFHFRKRICFYFSTVFKFVVFEGMARLGDIFIFNHDPPGIAVGENIILFVRQLGTLVMYQG